MPIPVYKIQSPLTQVTEESANGYLRKIEDALGEQLVQGPIEAWAAAPFGLIFVASGGSEGIFLTHDEQFAGRPLYILTSGESNSLAASMEILAYLRQRGRQGEILHGSVQKIAARIRALDRAARARQRLRGMRLGCIGAPSDWLIASPAADDAYRAKLGLSVIPIPMAELLEEIGKNAYPENEWTKRLRALGYDPAETEKALAVYGAARRMVDKYGLAGVTVRCFDLLDTVHTTGCLALAILNAEGIYAGCEGDVPSLVSMAILGEVSGNPVFMCNPSRIDTDRGEMVLAHCTLPVHMLREMALTTHYESGIGVAIAGVIPEGTCTVFKTSAGLDRHYAKEGVILENLREPTLCRTQIKVRLEDFSYFLTDPIQNHHLVCLGGHAAALDEFFSSLS